MLGEEHVPFRLAPPEREASSVAHRGEEAARHKRLPVVGVEYDVPDGPLAAYVRHPPVVSDAVADHPLVFAHGLRGRADVLAVARQDHVGETGLAAEGERGALVMRSMLYGQCQLAGKEEFEGTATVVGVGVGKWRCRRETIRLRQGYGGQARLRRSSDFSRLCASATAGQALCLSMPSCTTTKPMPPASAPNCAAFGRASVLQTLQGRSDLLCRIGR